MSSQNSLQFLPFVVWPGKSTKDRKTGTFRVAFLASIEDLKRELSLLGAKNIVVSTGHDAKHIRKDGLPMSTAKNPLHPGVILSCETTYGSPVFSNDTYTDWRDNLRAITLTLEALRGVDRWGANNGQQYKGFCEIAAAPAAPATVGQPKTIPSSNNYGAVLDVAAKLLLLHAGYAVTADSVNLLRRDPNWLRTVFNAAVYVVHPDKEKGSAETFMMVRQAFEALETWQKQAVYAAKEGHAVG